MNQLTCILLIEDDPAVARSLQDGLERERYVVTWKATGTEGVSYARDHNPHLIILDVRLPDGSGFDFCRQMRQSGLRQPILMLTVRADETDKVLGLEMGADDYVTKPYSLRELLSRVRALLRRAYGEFARADADLLYASDLVIDRGRGQVWRGEELINLTPTEFRLLVFLARHPGQALSRAQIIDAVWGYAADVESERAIASSVNFFIV
jgi:DNA-binding response OmpR family regulator